MFRWFSTITNTRGDSLPGWQVECVEVSDGQTVVPIFADENGTPIASVSDLPNRAVSDNEGNYDFFVPSGTYSLRFYNPAGDFQRLQRFLPMYGEDAANTENLASVNGAGLVGVVGGGTVQTSLTALAAADAARPTSAALAAATGSTLIGFQQSGTGAEPRDVQGKLREQVSVRDFGAVGDGVADDTAAIQAAINSGAKRIYLPEGTYRLTSHLSITSNGTTFFGANRRSTQLLQATDSADILRVSAQDCEIFCLSFDWVGTPSTTAKAVFFNVASFCTLREFRVEKAGIGVDVLVAVVLRIENFDIRNYLTCGIRLENINDAQIDQFIMDAGLGVNGTLGGIRLYNFCEAIKVSNGDIIRGEFALTGDADANAARLRPGANKFVNVYFDSSKTNNIFLDKCVAFDFIGCWFSFAGVNFISGTEVGPPNASAVGVSLGAVDDIRFIGGEIVSAHDNGMVIGPTSKRVLVDGMSIRECSLSNPGAASGIAVAANATDFRIVNSQLGGTPNLFSASGQLGWGIVIAAGTSDRYVIANNVFDNNALGAISDGGTGSDKRIVNNIGFRTARSGPALVPNGASTATINHGLAIAPEAVLLSPYSDINSGGVARFWVDNITATTFRINLNTATSADLFFSFDARAAGA
jgi:hypothetical protein